MFYLQIILETFLSQESKNTLEISNLREQITTAQTLEEVLRGEKAVLEDELHTHSDEINRLQSDARSLEEELNTLREELLKAEQDKIILTKEKSNVAENLQALMLDKERVSLIKHILVLDCLPYE